MSFIRSFVILLPMMAVIMVSFSNIFANEKFVYDVNKGSCYGYASYSCSLSKQESELGVDILASVASQDENSIFSTGLGLGYQYNFNSYFSTRLDVSGSAIFQPSAESSILPAISADLGFGLRVYPWKKTFFMGAGGMVRSAISLDSSVDSMISAQLYGYAELGFFFNVGRNTLFQIGAKIKMDIISLFTDKLTPEWDTLASMPFTFFVGWYGLFGKFGSLPSDHVYDALRFIKDQETYITFSNIFFDSESSKLDLIAEAQIQNILKLAQNYNPSMIIVRAYGDVQDKNIRKQQKTADARAQAVLEYLIAYGVQKNKIIAVGIPIKRATTQTLKERNQRLDIVLVK